MKAFEKDHDLKRLLTLIPYRPSISDPTIAFLDSLVRSGAMVLKLPGLSDIALARNLLAAGACEAIVKNDFLEVVLWLDADMYANRDVLFRQLNHLVEYEEDISDGMAALSGLYVRRREANMLAASRIDEQECKRTKDGTILVPAHTGMGCLVQSVVSFVSNCQLAEQLVNERGQTFPKVCKTDARTTKMNGVEVRAWGGEDYWYTERLWQTEVGVYLDTSCAWGHLSESLTLPSGLPEGLLTESEQKSLLAKEGQSSDRTH